MSKVTPMLKQYLDIKKDYPGTILFFRLGDFYELFNEDAIIGSKELEITLTSRHKKSSNPIPMCGVPHHAASVYISKLIRKGYRVAICEQIEDANASKKLVKREVVKVITPGTAIDEQLLEQKEPVYLCSIYGDSDVFGLAYLELSTGEFFVNEFTGADAWSRACQDIENLLPKEVIFPNKLQNKINKVFSTKRNVILNKNINNNVLDFSNRLESSSSFSTTLTILEDILFDFDKCNTELIKHFEVNDLLSFGIDNKTEIIKAAGACLDYVLQTQKETANHITDLMFLESKQFMTLDSITLKNLEIIESNDFDNSNKKTLLGVIDQTITGMGGRLLRSWILRPSIKRSEINTRLAAVEELTQTILRDQIRFLLKEVYDLERLIGRLNLGTASPRDLLALNQSLKVTPKINLSLSDAESLFLQVLNENIFELPQVTKLISSAISDEPSNNINDSGIIKRGFNKELDELRDISANAKQTIASFEASERKKTGINSLKVKFNNVFGYFIEVSKSNITRVPTNYERRQTLTNSERYTTPELKEWETKVLGAEEKIKEIELSLFKDIRDRIAEETKPLQSTARAIATLDALAALSEAATQNDYVKPELHEGDQISIKDGRHPIVELFSNQSFIPNDLLMNNSTDRLLIITGANMGGKSTILRQIALIQILAQIGSYVPAKSAKLPIVDRVWTRVGASDDLASGRSTFMVEMTETATILKNATPKSLILLDEIGRGTSTFDGLAIAWAVSEYLHNSPDHSAKTLFATHYHELTELAEKLPGAKNYQLTAKEVDGDIVFLHKLKEGKASKSYGIAVAKLAGLPKQTIARAKEVLSKLEQYELAVFNDNQITRKKGLENAVGKAVATKAASQVSLFAISNENVIDELRNLNMETVDEGSALEILINLKNKII